MVLIKLCLTSQLIYSRNHFITISDEIGVIKPKFYGFLQFKHSRDLKSDHSKPRLFEEWISVGPVVKGSGYNISYSSVPNHFKTVPFKIWTFLSGFQMVGLPDFRSHGPFANQPLFYHLKSRPFRISGPHCTLICVGPTWNSRNRNLWTHCRPLQWP